MHDETFLMLKACAEKWRAIYLERYQTKRDAPGMEPLASLAQIEAMLEAAERQHLPGRFARVHAMGHTTYRGPVASLGRGYRVEDHVLGEVGDHKVGVIRHWHDVHAVHSVEYLTDAEWAEELEQLQKKADEANEERQRQATTPDGYTLIEREPASYYEGPHGFRDPAGEEHWHDEEGEPFRSKGRANEVAWDYSERNAAKAAQVEAASQ